MKFRILIGIVWLFFAAPLPAKTPTATVSATPKASPTPSVGAGLKAIKPFKAFSHLEAEDAEHFYGHIVWLWMSDEGYKGILKVQMGLLGDGLKYELEKVTFDPSSGKLTFQTPSPKNDQEQLVFAGQLTQDILVGSFRFKTARGPHPHPPEAVTLKAFVADDAFYKPYVSPDEYAKWVKSWLQREL